MTPQTSTASSLPGSTWALLTGRTVTWRQAGEGWAVLVIVSVSAVAAVAAVQTGRHLVRSRRRF